MRRPDSTTNDAAAVLSFFAARHLAQRRPDAARINNPNIPPHLSPVPGGNLQPERHRRCACSEQHLIVTAKRSVPQGPLLRNSHHSTLGAAGSNPN